MCYHEIFCHKPTYAEQQEDTCDINENLTKIEQITAGMENISVVVLIKAQGMVINSESMRKSLGMNSEGG